MGRRSGPWRGTIAGGEGACGAAEGCISAAAAGSAGGSGFNNGEEVVGAASGTATDCTAGGPPRGAGETEFGAAVSGAADVASSCMLDAATVSFAGCFKNKNPEPRNAPVVPMATSPTRTR